MNAMLKSEIRMLRPDWDVNTAMIQACFTEREGGVSSGPWGNVDGIMGLNLAFHTGDAARCVEMNRAMVREDFPAEPVWLNQVHGDQVVDAAQVGPGVVPDADASFTTQKGVVLAVMVADCLPILVADQYGRGVAAIHGGWRSLAAGIIGKTLSALEAAMRTKPSLSAWLGPRIGTEHFEVGQEVFNAITQTYPRARDAFVLSESSGRYHCDLAAVATLALREAGVNRHRIFDSTLDTYSQCSSFWSYRRDGLHSGRHGAFIYMRPDFEVLNF